MHGQDKYRLQHWDIEDGMSQSIAGYMLKDSAGFLWISTENGLSRFDGGSFKNYFSGSDNQAISSNETLGLIEDSLYNIWIGSNNGLSVYDTKADTFKQILSSLSQKYIDPFWATKDEVLCLEGDFTITAYNIHNFKRTVKARVDSFENLQLNDNARSIAFDEESNSCWVLQGYINGSIAGVYNVSLKTGKCISYIRTNSQPIAGKSNDAEALRFDRKRNCLWLNSGDGLIQFTLADKKFHRIEALTRYENLKEYIRFVGIDIDTSGRIWFASEPRGIMIFNPDDQSVQTPFADSARQRNITEANYSIYCDRDGIVWSSFWVQKGLYQLTPLSPTITHYRADINNPSTLSNDAIINSVNADYGELWFGSFLGLNVFNPLTGVFERLTEKELLGIKGKQIIPVYVDTVAQKGWLVTEVGYYEVDLLTKHCKPVIFKNKKGDDITKDLQIFILFYGGYCGSHKTGAVLAAGYKDEQYIFIATADSAIVHPALTFPFRSILLYNTVIGADGLLFLHEKAGPMHAYTKVNNKWQEAPTPLNKIKVVKLFYNDKDQTYWVFAEGDLTHYSKSFKTIHTYNEKNGLSRNDIFGLTTDNRGNIWFNTDRSIFKMDINSGKINTLTMKDGFPNVTFSSGTPVIKDFNGNLYFPTGIRGAKGIIKINPEAFRTTYPPSSVYIRSLLVNQQPVPSFNYISGAQLKLTYDQNNINIQTGIIDYYSNNTCRIRYKLEGLNDTWQYGPANYIINYDALPAKDYKLLIQSSNAADEFNGPVKVLAIAIRPPFWKTWWFYTLMALASLVMLNVLFRIRLRQKMQILKVRQKLHRDLHDDVGATLSAVKVYSEILQADSQNPVIIELIKNNAIDMIDKLEVIAWATNPQHDTYKSFKELITHHASSVCYAKQINLLIKVDEISETTVMPGDIRQNLFLIFKEALNNIIKHAEASECQVSLSMHNQQLCFMIADNGKGFLNKNEASGNGLKNMYRRAEEIKAKMVVHSTPEGTILTINLGDRL